jgi:hypothetical protein
MVFRGRGDGIAVLPARTNGHRDLQLLIVTQAGANVDEVTFRSRMAVIESPATMSRMTSEKSPYQVTAPYLQCHNSLLA